MEIPEFEAMLSEPEKEYFRTKLLPALPLLIRQGARHDETVQFFLAKIREAQELVRKWRSEFPDSDIAKKCATDLEAIVIAREDGGPRISN